MERRGLDAQDRRCLIVGEPIPANELQLENTTISATGWLQVACTATTLRHLPRAGTRRQAQPLAA